MSNSKEQPRTHKTHIHTSPFITGVFLAVMRVRDHRLNPLHFVCLNRGQVGKLRHLLRPRRVSKLLSLNHRRGFVGGYKRGCVCVLVVLCISADTVSVCLHSVPKLAGPRLRKLQCLTSKLRFSSPPSSPWPSGWIEGVAHLGCSGCVCVCVFAVY